MVGASRCHPISGTARQLQADGMSIGRIAEAVGSRRATVHRALAGGLVMDLTTAWIPPSRQALPPAGMAAPALVVRT
jgi:hypothetical protein